MKKRLLEILIIGLFCLFPITTYALESIPITTTIENISNPTNAIITYQIKENGENIKGVQNAPTQIIADFSNQEVVNNTISKETIIDFSNTVFPAAGIYRYGLLQKETNDSHIILSSKMYEIFVEVTLQENGTLIKEVDPLVVDLDEYGKGPIEYLNTTHYTTIKIENRMDGELKEYDKDIYFRYRLSIDGPVGSIYTIMGQEEEVVFDGRIVETTNQYIVKPQEAENYVYIYLKKDQSVTIGWNPSGFGEIPIGIQYKIKKTSAEKWNTYINNQERDERSFITTGDENYCLIVHKRDFDSAVTGLFYNVLPFVLIISIILISTLLIMKWSQKKK